MTSASLVVATDFSAQADRAVDRARQLAGQFGWRLRAVHALDVDEAEGADRAALEQRMRQCVMAGPDERVEFAFPVGTPPRAIARCAEAEDVRLLVVGPARYNSLGDYVTGTAVDHILRYTAKPVLVVKNRPYLPYRSIVAATDFSEPSADAIIAAVRLFPTMSVHIVHGCKVPRGGVPQESGREQDFAAQMQEFVEMLSAREPRLADATSDVVRGAPVDAVHRALELDPAALVVVGSYGATGLRQAVIGSVVSDLLRQVDADFLVLTPGRA